MKARIIKVCPSEERGPRVRVEVEFLGQTRIFFFPAEASEENVVRTIKEVLERERRSLVPLENVVTRLKKLEEREIEIP